DSPPRGARLDAHGTPRAGRGGRALGARERGGPGEGPPRDGGALGARDARVLPDGRAGDEAGSAPGARAAGRRGDGGALSARRAALLVEGRGRGPSRVRGEAEAALAEPVLGTPETGGVERR